MEITKTQETMDNTMNFLPPMKASTLPEIAHINEMKKGDLIAYWETLFDEEPTISSVPLLKRRLIHAVQVNALNKRHKDIVSSNEKRITAMIEKEDRSKKHTVNLSPGTVLTRFYKGQDHIVLVSPSGKFIYNDIIYDSLSAIAKVITGTQWSGPVFFGLKK